MSRRTRIAKRGSRAGEHQTFIGAWIPLEIEEAIQVAIRNYPDTDKSKFIRQSLEEKVARELEGEAA